MKKAPTTFQADGALGEQLSFIALPLFCPTWPSRNNFADRAPRMFLDRRCRMSYARSDKTEAGSVHPLLASPCTCSLPGGALCLACMRWRRHYGAVMQRSRAWGATR